MVVAWFAAAAIDFRLDARAAGQPPAVALADSLRLPAVSSNRPPLLQSELPMASGQEGRPFRYDFHSSFTDADEGDSLRYSARLADGGALPSWLKFDGVLPILEGIPARDDVGTCMLKLTAMDRSGLAAEGSLLLEVSPSTLSLADFLDLVVERNGDIEVERLNWKLNEKLAFSARGIYEPVLKLSAKREWNKTESSAQEITSRLGAEYFDENNNLFNAALEGFTPFGGSYRVGYDLAKHRNTVIDAYDALSGYIVYNPEYVTMFGLNVTQPLLKGAGYKVTNANIRIARSDTDIAYEGFRQVSMETASKAVQIYWQCYGAQEKLRMRRRSLELATRILNLGRKRYEAGKIPYTAVMDAETGVLVRQAMADEAEQTELMAKKRIIGMFGSRSTVLDPAYVRVAERPDMLAVIPDVGDLVKHAYAENPKYRGAVRTVEREKIQMEYAENQRWPKLDVKAGYGLNGLDSSFESSWEKARTQEYLSWSIGVELEVPILGDIKARNEYAAARLRKLQAEKRLETERTSIANELEVLAGQVRGAYLQYLRYKAAVALSAERLRIEEVRQRYGKSDIGQVLEREENLLKTREELLNSMIGYQTAMAELFSHEGTLLDRYGLTDSIGKGNAKD